MQKCDFYRDMQRLNLAKNKLSLIPHDALSGLAYLETLELSDNPINQINEGDFNGKLFHSPSQFSNYFSIFLNANVHLGRASELAATDYALSLFYRSVRCQMLLMGWTQLFFFSFLQGVTTSFYILFYKKGVLWFEPGSGYIWLFFGLWSSFSIFFVNN